MRLVRPLQWVLRILRRRWVKHDIFLGCTVGMLSNEVAIDIDESNSARRQITLVNDRHVKALERCSDQSSLEDLRRGDEVNSCFNEFLGDIMPICGQPMAHRSIMR